LQISHQLSGEKA
jgi:SHAQKYF class myb-like DNA-binding protein